MKNFQIIIIVVFIFAGIFGLMAFSGFIKIGKKTDENLGVGTIVIWGTINNEAISPVIEEFNKNNPTFVTIYEQKSEDSFDKDLLEALAIGAGPDLMFISNDMALRHINKIFKIPYSSFSINSFKNKFIGAGEVFLTSKGILALPVAVNPLVMYYNRSVLDDNGILFPPSNWKDIQELAVSLTKRDKNNKITRSAVALGGFSNISNAKGILSALFLQTKNKIIIESDNGFTSTLHLLNEIAGPSSVLEFYTSFSDPLRAEYSWNRSLPSSIDGFTFEDLVFYFGFADELPIILERNPNQNFSVALLPQITNNGHKSTFAKTTGIAVLSSSKNFNTAFFAANLISTGNLADKFASALNGAPALRSLLNVQTQDEYSQTFYTSAIFANSWLDPSPAETDILFKNMVESVLSNSLTPNNAIIELGSKLNLLLRKLNNL